MKWLFCIHKYFRCWRCEENPDVHHMNEHSEFDQRKEGTIVTGHQDTVHEESGSNDVIQIV